MKLIKTVVIASALVLAACPAKYTIYHKDANGAVCYVTVVSYRMIEGADLGLDKDCALKGSADSMKNSDKVVDLLDSVLKTARELAL